MTHDKNTVPPAVPRHVAIIMDGNGRWAKARGRDRSEGHVQGVTTVRTITEEASRLGIGYLTLYTFSTENWNRPQAEVNALMHLVSVAIERETPDLIRNNVRLRLIGDIDRLPRTAADSLRCSVEATSASTGLTLVLAISYSARWELTRAARILAEKAASGAIRPEAITEADVTASLATAGMPDPDLLIRTGGDHRISNFLLWQIAYSEIYVTPTLWPDFSAEEFRRAIADFASRERRFGKTSEQIRQTPAE